MKANIALGLALVAVVIAILGLSHSSASQTLGSTGTRYPNGVSANSNSPVAGQLRGTSVKLDTSNTATSTSAVGCIQTTATSTATPIRLVIVNNTLSTTTFRGGSAGEVFPVYAQYGTCP